MSERKEAKQEIIIKKETGKRQNNELELDKAEYFLQWTAKIAPEIFWSKFPKRGEAKPKDIDSFYLFYKASINLVKAYLIKVKDLGIYDEAREIDVKFLGRNFCNPLKYLTDNFVGQILSSPVRDQIDIILADEIIEAFYTCGFHCMTSVKVESEDKNEECSCCFKKVCVCTQIVSQFKEANIALKELGLMEELVGLRVYSVVKKQISIRVEQTKNGKYDVSQLDSLLNWLDLKMLPWIDIIYPENRSINLQKLKEEFQALLYELYGKSIINDLFSVVIEFPDSKPFLEDLRICMRNVPLRNELVSKLRSALERRLLNAGVNTSDVLEAYVSTVRALKFLDPSGILIQLVSPPVREYLKQRDETVRVILVSLTEESGDLAEELAKNPTIDKRSSKLVGANWREWEPDPIDVPRDKQNLRKSDMIQALVSIYGSKTLFIDEYRALLADRLLKMPKPCPKTFKHEIKCLELLKLRFGEADLQKCEVMLKDVSDSQRLNYRFYEEEEAVLADQEIPVTGLVVSAQFWPTFKSENLEVPEIISTALNKYTKAFEMIKGNRTLEWQKHIGTVELDIQIGETTFNFTVNPAQASIIHNFQDQDMWTLENLSKKTGMSSHLLRNRIGFWISKGILIESSPDTFRVHEGINEDVEPILGVKAGKFIEDLESDSPMTSTSTQKETELQMFWSYIEGMLTNLESLPLSRIHSMLKLFATVECTIDELQKFLDQKVIQGILLYSGGQYSINVYK